MSISSELCAVLWTITTDCLNILLFYFEVLFFAINQLPLVLYAPHRRIPTSSKKNHPKKKYNFKNYKKKYALYFKSSEVDKIKFDTMDNYAGMPRMS